MGRKYNSNSYGRIYVTLNKPVKINITKILFVVSALLFLKLLLSMHCISQLLLVGAYLVFIVEFYKVGGCRGRNSLILLLCKIFSSYLVPLPFFFSSLRFPGGFKCRNWEKPWQVYFVFLYWFWLCILGHYPAERLSNHIQVPDILQQIWI